MNHCAWLKLSVETKLINQPVAGYPPVILASQQAEIRRIMVGSQPGQIVHETLSRKHPIQKRVGGVAQNVGPEFKSQYCQKKLIQI
jgi:hypothetical protein